MRANPAHPSSSLVLCHLSLGLIFSNPGRYIERVAERYFIYLFMCMRVCVGGWIRWGLPNGPECAYIAGRKQRKRVKGRG